ncbi:hypothetical protein N4G70_13535 [Streptomyces sp. ASQP_92]|uniref:hypothetical protein n=1 Tax=unclassified Streptomyces TaxID=2593676 RepID=UPI0021BFAD09|nr:hypothetical protein [Streptomyces sp. ASQP_92]MCT9089885.1 hypothetical protein [Streptomyces sp. ASQP_92]
MTDDSTATATPRSRGRTVLAVVLTLVITGLVWAPVWYFFGWHSWGIAWLASKAAAKAVVLGPPLVAGAAMWLRQMYKKRRSDQPEDDQRA